MRGDVVERLERRAVRDRGVADDGDHVPVSGKVPRRRDAERRGERRSRVAAAERVVRAFPAGTEAGDAARLAQRVESLAVAPREQLVRVALVRDVEDDAVARRRKHAVKRDRELDDAEVRADVPAVFRRDGDDAFPQLSGELGEFFGRQFLDVVRT